MTEESDNRDKEYRIKECERREADFYGDCERCGRRCVPHYKQQYRKTTGLTKGWSNCGYGHIHCLRNGNWQQAPVVGAEER